MKLHEEEKRLKRERIDRSQNKEHIRSYSSSIKNKVQVTHYPLIKFLKQLKWIMKWRKIEVDNPQFVLRTLVIVRYMSWRSLLTHIQISNKKHEVLQLRITVQLNILSFLDLCLQRDKLMWPFHSWPERFKATNYPHSLRSNKFINFPHKANPECFQLEKVLKGHKWQHW